MKGMWDTKQARGTQEFHSLESFCPPLASRLKANMDVLDVGCGPGSVTLGIAERVRSVVGIDMAPASIEKARLSAQERGISNVTFAVGDAHVLQLEDDRFDLAFSSAVLEWVTDPVKVVREQTRVVKSGGVVTARCGSFEITELYPPCPNFTRWRRAICRTYEWEEHFFNHDILFRLFEVFTKASLRSFAVETFAPPIGCVYQGSPEFEKRYDIFKSARQSVEFVDRYRQLVERGILPEDTWDKADAEYSAWHAHPYAFEIEPSVLAVGIV